MRFLGLRILDRYILTELAGPFGFGLSAFMMIFAATNLLALGRLVSAEHAPLGAAIQVFLWTLPGEVVFVIPMALLLGVLLAMQRLSGESEITAMKAGGISFFRIVAPLAIAGLVFSVLTYVLAEQVAPYAQGRVTEIEDQAIAHTNVFNRDLTESIGLPGGGRQVMIATSYEPNSQALLNVTLVQYNKGNDPTQIVFAHRAEFSMESWELHDASIYRFNPDGTTIAEPHIPMQRIALQEKPSDIVRRAQNNDPQQMSRTEIAAVIKSGQLSQSDLAKYQTTFQEKLAQPFACLVFVLISVPFGMRARRGGGNTSLGFGLAVAIAFIYYVVMTVFSYISQAAPDFAGLWAWMPNVIFTIFGVVRLWRVGSV